MLVLTRKLMEKLFIGENICITVVRLEGGQVRLGIDAPRDVTVVRAELVPERLAGNNRTHAQGQTPPGAAVPSPVPGPNGPRPDGPVRIPPDALRENGNQRRGRSR
jgi:carbon storage regulator